MKHIIKLMGLFIFIAFSFFYTDKVVSVVKNNDPIMDKIKEAASNYKQDPQEAKITKKTIIPGISGKTINIDKSYKKMHEIFQYSESLLVYDEIKPKHSLTNNKDKFIIQGNSNKKMVSIIFILENDKYLTRIEELATSKETVINYFVDYKYLINNATNISKITTREFYNYGTNGTYTPDNLIFANNLITRITSNEAIYCLSTNKNKKIINLCSKNNLYTINPNIIIKNNPYQTIKNNLQSGSIILMEMTNDTSVELGIIIDYIRGKGLKIVGLSTLLSE